MQPGITLIEIMIAMAVFSLLGVMVYGSFSGSLRAQQDIEALQARNHEVRLALLRISRELQGAFLVKNTNQISLEALRSQTIFVGKQEGGSARLDFTALSHQRTQADVNESDQCEISYFVRASKDQPGKRELVRRESKRIDADPTKGGVLSPVVRGVSTFELEYYDFEKQDWLKEWNSNDAIGQPDRLPPFVRVTLGIDDGDGERKLSTIVKLPLTAPIMEVR
jgi:type II secretion system protein J